MDFKKHKRHRLKTNVPYDSYDPYDSNENQAFIASKILVKKQRKNKRIPQCVWQK